MSLQDIIIGIKEDSERADVRALLAAIEEAHGRGIVQAVSSSQEGDAEHRPFDAGIISAADLPPGSEPKRIWFGLYPGSVVLIIGETGAGKSSLLYNIALHGARNDRLYDVDFGLNRPLNILYADPENAGNWQENVGGICALKVDRINGGRPENLFFHDWRTKDLTKSATEIELVDFIKKRQIDICFLDPIANIFGTEDENDNAEAAKQMKVLTRLSRETGCCIILCHHTGKVDSGNYGRGASARLAAADVGMIFRVRSDDDADDDFTGELQQRSDVCRLQIVKNRWEGRASLYLIMAGEDVFKRVDQQMWKNAAKTKPVEEKPVQKLYRAKDAIMGMMEDGQERTARAIIEEIKSLLDIGERNTQDALKELVEDDLITSRREKNTVFYVASQRNINKENFCVATPLTSDDTEEEDWK